LSSPKRILRAAEVILILLAGEVLLAVTLALVGFSAGFEGLNPIAHSRLTGLLAYVPPLLYIKLRKISVGETDPWRRPSFREAAPLCGATCALASGFVVAHQAMAGNLSPVGTAAADGMTLFGHLESLAVDLIAAPALEELIFRGVLLSALIGSMNRGAAVFISAMVFSLSHLSVAEIPGATLLGIISGFAFVRSESLVLCMLAHFVWNATVVFFGAL